MKLAERMSRIGVESAPGEVGSCFVFTLPVHVYNSISAPPAAWSNNASSGDSASTTLDPPQAAGSHSTTRHPSSFDVHLVAPTTEEQL